MWLGNPHCGSQPTFTSESRHRSRFHRKPYYLGHMRTPLYISIVCLALVGCASTRTVRSQSDLDSLPRSRGVYGGSWLVHTWSYTGSDANYDHFDYTYTHDNFARRVPVRMAKSFVVLGFEPRAYQLPDGGVPVTPDYRAGRLVGFAIYTNAVSSRPTEFFR
jgi:hypothetical protein